MIAEILFWLCVVAIFHSYLFYPILIRIASKSKKFAFEHWQSNEELPTISVVMSAYNEEEVIEAKIKSVLHTQLPSSKVEIVVGSDCSTDATNEIMAKLAEKYPSLTFVPFTERQGKGNIINQLLAHTTGNILVLTDANVMFSPDTLFELATWFKDKRIGLVDSRMINTRVRKKGISVQESAYISREVKIKQQESLLWGTMMGPFGGCYALRRELYTQVPPNYLVDDFYICMKVLEHGKMAVNNINAKVYEDVSNNPSDEFRRKIRIATGNFQNLYAFKHLLWFFKRRFSNKQKAQKTNDRIQFPTSGLVFSFLSHKVLRWLGPFFILTALGCCSYLAMSSTLYVYLLVAYMSSMLLPVVDISLRELKIHSIILRFITHFYAMNLALLIGFYKYLKGVKNNVWQPTKRNQ